jgi:hypothetical protein
LIEPESVRLGELGWPYSKRHEDWNGTVPFGEVLHDYILWVHYGQIAAINLWLNRVPVGGTVECTVGAITALPVRPLRLENPVLEIGVHRAQIPATLQSGNYLELSPQGAGTVYDALGEPIDTFEVAPLSPVLKGENRLRLSADKPGAVRARLTLTTLGPLVTE